MMSPYRLFSNCTGSAAAELALVTPLLLVILAGTFEVGNYFRSEHLVQKAVRDAARYAARLPMTNYPSCTPTSTAEQQIRRVAKAGDPDGDYDNNGTQDQRLPGWTADNQVTVSMSCDTSGTYTGIYSDFPGGAPKVTVSAHVPYDTFFGTLGLGTATIYLNATSQAAVIGA